ncbi:hypothetical protein ACTA71_002018 [Dictyostelium dimigraforme]
MKLISFICLLIIVILFVGNCLSKDLIKIDENTCNMCNSIVKFEENFITDNANEKELLQKLDGYCALKLSKNRQSCVNTVNNYGISIIKLLVNKEDVNNICTTLELCSSSSAEIDIDHKLSEAEIFGGMFCESCKDMIGPLEGMSESSATNYLKQEAQNFCNKFPSFISGYCYNYIINDAPQIITDLNENQGSNQICQGLGFCGSSSSSSLAASKLYQTIKLPLVTEIFGGMFCESCKDMIGPLEGMGESSATSYLKEEAQNFCNKFPSFISGYCYNYIVNDSPQIITCLNENQSPNQICQELSFCGSSSASLYQAIQLPLETEIFGGMFCESCKDIIGPLEGMTGSSATNYLEQEAQDFCNKFPSFISGYCYNSIVNDAPQIIADLNENQSPNQICQELSFCGSSRNFFEQLKSSLVIKLPLVTEIYGGMFCQSCKDMIGPLEGMSQSSAIDYLKEEAQNFCNKFPSFISGYCYNYIVNDGQQIITYLNEGQGSNQICQELEFCASSLSSTYRAIPQSTKEATTLCGLCKDFVSGIRETVEKHSGDVEADLLKECKVFFGWDSLIEKQCETIITQDLDAIVNAVESNLSPTAFCQDFFHIC